MASLRNANSRCRRASWMAPAPMMKRTVESAIKTGLSSAIPNRPAMKGAASESKAHSMAPHKSENQKAVSA